MSMNMNRPRSGRDPGRALRVDPFDLEAHTAAHLPNILVYTSAATLTTDASVPICPPRGGRIVTVHANVKVAPTSTMEIDVLIGATSIFPDGTYVTITNGELTSGLNESGEFDDGDARFPGDVHNATFRAFEAITIDIITIAAATGPLVAQLEIDWDN